MKNDGSEDSILKKADLQSRWLQACLFLMGFD